METTSRLISKKTQSGKYNTEKKILGRKGKSSHSLPHDRGGFSPTWPEGLIPELVTGCRRSQWSKHLLPSAPVQWLLPQQGLAPGQLPTITSCSGFWSHGAARLYLPAARAGRKRCDSNQSLLIWTANTHSNTTGVTRTWESTGFTHIAHFQESETALAFF